MLIIVSYIFCLLNVNVAEETLKVPCGRVTNNITLYIRVHCMHSLLTNSKKHYKRPKLLTVAFVIGHKFSLEKGKRDNVCLENNIQDKTLTPSFSK